MVFILLSLPFSFLSTSSQRFLQSPPPHCLVVVFMEKMDKVVSVVICIYLLEILMFIQSKTTLCYIWIRGFPRGSVGKESTCNAGDMGSVPGSRRSPVGGCGNRPQYPCLENPMDRGAWQTTVHGVAKSRTRLKGLSMHACSKHCRYIKQ